MKAKKEIKKVFGKYQEGGKTGSKQKLNDKKRKEEVFQRDSTNLENATQRYLKSMNKKDEASMSDYIQGSDSLRAISKRREGDKEFWDRMNPKKAKGGKVEAKMAKGGKVTSKKKK